MSEWPQRSGFGPVPATSASVDYAVPGPSPEHTATAGRRPRRGLAVGVVGVLALLATGLAVTQLTGSDGAESPEAAVQAFFDAVDDEDAMGVLESLSPSERDLLVPSVRKLADQLDRVEVSEDADLQKVDGIDLKVEGLELRTKGLHPDVAAVEVSGGSISVAAKLADLPLGKALTGALEEEGGLDLDEPLHGSGLIDLTLVTVRSGDGWHVSVLYSLAEAARAESDVPVPDFGNGIPARGADSPEAAVEAMVAAFNDQDYSRMIELTPPDSMAVLHDYGPGLLAAEEDGNDGGYGYGDIRLEDVELGDPEGSGDTRRLPLEGYRFVMTSDGEASSSYTYDGACITSTLPSMAFTIDDDDTGAPEAPEATEDAERCVGDGPATRFELGSIVPPAGPLLLGPGQADLVVVERGGAWYVDPARTIIDTFLLNMGAMTPGQAERMVENLAVLVNPDEEAWYASMPAEMYESCPDVEPPADDASFEERKEAGLECSGQSFERFESVGEAITGDQEQAEEACVASSADQATVDACIDDLYRYDGSIPSEDCWSSDDDAAIEACLLALGDTEGVGQIHMRGCYQSVEDATVEACLQDLVDKGEIGAEVVAGFRCEAVYETVPDDAVDDDYQAVDEAYDRCMADAGIDPDAPYGDGQGSASTPSVPAPSTTTG